MGNGIYAQKLDEKKWIEFNNAQRVHYNYLEQLPIALPLALFSGLFQAKFTAAGCVSYILGRELYMRGYMTKGPDGRYRGAPFLYPAMIAWLGITVHGAAKMLGWF
ncbi:hypothetical protein BCR44DRAFT_41669 [Catenaria anguillulae PL171]|uniref:Membrane-associated, eicosanoid/glutathione metabolism protein n=1 Tax=Catenaria anguillulae PL171 TaxID=765915 RepID=A0A1Y2HGN0_9FUNG|nr:hypothetical protein BCR44DRAFT_41669 [Catenaria anguillulae PL171]